MFWVRNNRVKMALFSGVALVGALAIASPAMAQSRVVRSTGPSAAQYPTGKKIAANGTIRLQRGDRVTVLDKSGTRVLTGPGTFSLNRRVAATSTSNRIEGFLTSKPNRRARTGAVRGGSSTATRVTDTTLAARSPNLWFVDISHGGTHCVIDPSQTLMWRPDVRSDKTATLASTTGGAEAELAWRRGSTLKRWPNDSVAIQHDVTYALSDENAAEPVNLTVKLLPEEPDGLDATADALINNGCDHQLDLLVAILDDSNQSVDAAPEGEGD